MPSTKTRAAMALLALAALGPLAACGGSGGEKGDTGAATVSAAPETPSVQATATGDTIIVEMITDEKGNYFKPAEIEAEPGDLVRFTLTSGVHNVHFVPDSNAVKTGLPPASDMLQLPGQTWDLVVTMPPGSYYFQCDPHALLGMVGRLKVEEPEQK